LLTNQIKPYFASKTVTQFLLYFMQKSTLQEFFWEE
jgi:hypothetical protein